MLFNTFQPGKFAFASEDIDLDDLRAQIQNDESNSPIDFLKSKKWGIIGVPFDSTCSYHNGSRYGPTVIREASFGFENFNSRFGRSLDGEFFDCGDLNIVHGNCERTCGFVEDAAGELIDANIKPILIGGEHSISIGSIKALADRVPEGDLSDITIIHLDAHRDIIDEYIGEKNSHATIMKRVHDLNPKELIQIGIRSFSLEEAIFVENNENITSFETKHLFNGDGFGYLMQKLATLKGKVYISIDMDVMDPSVAPSVGNPTPGGLLVGDIEKIFALLYENPQVDIIGFDLVEVATDKLGDITAVLAAKIIYDFLTLFA